MDNRCSSQVRLFAGSVVLLGVLGSTLFGPLLLLSTFIGLMLIQSSVTGFCPAELLLPGCR